MKASIISPVLSLALLVAIGACLHGQHPRDETGPSKRREDLKVRTDLQGDPLPPDALLRLGTSRFRYSGTQVAFVAEGRVLASSVRSHVALWEAATGKFIRAFLAKDGEHEMVFSPDGRLLAQLLMGKDYNPESVWLWDVSTGKEIRQFKFKDLGYCLAFSADGKLLLATESTGEAMRLLEVATGKEIRRFQGDEKEGHFTAAVLAPDGKTIAVVRELNPGGYKVGLWEVATGKKSRQVAVAARQVKIGGPFERWAGSTCRIVAFSPDSRMLASGGDDAVRLWDVRTAKEIRQFPVHHHPGTVAFSADGRTLAFDAPTRVIGPNPQDRAVQLWEVATGKPIRQIHSGFERFAWSPDGKALATPGGSLLRLWDATTGEELCRYPGQQRPVRDVTFTANDRMIVSQGDDCRIMVWDAVTGREIRQLSNTRENPHHAAYSADGRTAAFMHATYKPATDKSSRDSYAYVVNLLDTATGKELRQFKGMFAVSTGHGLFSAGNRLFALDGRKLCDLTADKEICEFDSKSKELHGPIALSPNGRLLAGQLGSMVKPDRPLFVDRIFQSAGLHLWDATTGKIICRLEDSAAAAEVNSSSQWNRLSFSADGQVLLGSRQPITTETQTLIVWEAAMGRKIRELPTLHDAFGRAAISPDGGMVAMAAAQGEIVLLDVATGQEIRRFQGHGFEGLRNSVSCLAFSGDGRKLLSGSFDTTVLVWDLNSDRSDQPVQLAPQEMDRLWLELAGSDACKACAARRTMVRAPKQAVALLQARLRPAVPPDPRRIKQLIVDLDDRQFAVRLAASRELEQTGELATTALKEVLNTSPSLELRQRVETLLASIETSGISPELAGALRGVAILERLHSPEARLKLEELSKGAPGARLTREAQAALKQWTQNSSDR
jgi:WD40 repeat protein